MRPNIPRLFLTPWMPELAYTLLRVFTGVLLIYHGGKKIFDGLGTFIGELAARGWPMAALQGFLSAYTEFAGGVFLIVGLFTRPVAAVCTVMFTIITFVWHGADPFGKQEKALVFLALSIFFLLCGPGKWSVDVRLFTKNATPGRD